MGLPNTIDKAQYGVKLFNLCDRDGTPCEEILESYSAKDFHGEEGEKKFWDLFNDLFPEKDEIQIVEEAMEGLIEMKIDDKDSTDTVIQKQRTTSNKCNKIEM